MTKYNIWFFSSLFIIAFLINTSKLEMF